MAEPERAPCPLCGLDGLQDWLNFESGVRSAKCPRCGEFQWAEAFRRALEDTRASTDTLARLSNWTRQSHERGRRITLDVDALAEAAAAGEAPVAVKARKLLQAFASREDHPGGAAVLSLELDYPLLDVGSRSEMVFFVEYLLRAGLIDGRTYPKGVEGDADETVRAGVTFEGWQFLEPLRKTQMVPGRVFVAMSFHEDLDEAYQNGIEPAIAAAECEPRMLKGMIHSENISNKILAEIAQAEFVVADMTHGSHGAYFEAGYAMALGRKVVFTCREDHWSSIHFDTAQYPYIKWSDTADLREKLCDWLMALKGQAG